MKTIQSISYRRHIWCLYTFLAFLIFNFSLSAQDVLYVKGAITVKLGENLYVQGGVNSSGSGDITNNGTIHLVNHATVGGEDWTNGVSTSLLSGTGIVNFNSTEVQTIGGSSATTFNNLTVNNAAGISLSKNATVSSTLTMTSGNITTATDNDTLVLGTSTANLGTLSRTTGTVIGSMRRWFDAATVANVVFPVGTDANYRPANISFTGATTTGGTLSSSFVAVSPGTNGLPIDDAGTTIETSGIDGYWTLNAAHGLAGGTYNLDLTADAFNGVDEYTTLRLLKRSSSANPWTLDGTHSAGTGSNATPVVHRTGMTGFSEFGVGGSSDNPLPITLLSFVAEWNNSKQSEVSVQWITTVELNTDYFEIEHSSDGKEWKKIAAITAVGNSNTKVEYEIVDCNPYKKMTYYRLKQFDFDGNYAYSDIIAITKEEIAVEIISMYPNPTSDYVLFNLISTEETNVHMLITNSIGKVLFSEEIVVNSGESRYKVDVSSYPASEYVVNIVTGSGAGETSKIFVKY